MNQDLWHYDVLEQWNEEYYKDVFLPTHLTGDEIAIGSEDERVFFFTAKKDNKMYLIPSEIIQDDEIPFKLNKAEKIGVKGKAFWKVDDITCVSIRAEKTMSYKEMINSWMDYEHENKESFILWKIITDTFYCSRINVRVVTYPGWLKDSVPFTLSRLLGNCFTINKPSLAKLKYLLNNSTTGLCLNEIQKLESKEKIDLAKFYEDVGDFKTIYTNPTRASSKVQEQCNIKNLSTFTFSNFPDSNRSYEEQKKDVFDNIFEPKVRSRIFPLLFVGGNEKNPACKQRFNHVTERITKEQVEEITQWMRNYKYYEKNGQELSLKKHFKNSYSMKNTRWDRNFQAICQRIKLYCDTQEEFDKFVKLLYDCNKEYVLWVNNYQNVLKPTNPVDTPQQELVLDEKRINNQLFEEEVVEVAVSAKERVFEAIDKAPEGKIQVEVLLEKAGVSEEILKMMLTENDIFEVKSGVIARL